MTVAFDVGLGPTTLDTAGDRLAHFMPIAVLFVGAALVTLSIAMHGNAERTAATALEVAYLPNSLLTLITFWNRWQIGAALAAVASLVYAIDIFVSTAPARTRGA